MFRSKSHLRSAVAALIASMHVIKAQQLLSPQAESLKGTLSPASAYILWPYTPRVVIDKFPVIGWAHGTGGGFGECAPSHIRNLRYQFTAPYTLALQGYVVVAPDYAGLGVDRDTDGNIIRYPYTANPSHANDLFFSVQAVQPAFGSLSKRLVTMGHSQGGEAAWGAAQRQASRPVEGYLGAIAGSPVTDVHDLVQLGGVSDGAVGSLIANGLRDIILSFNLTTFLTPAGLRLYSLVSDIQGCNSVVSECFYDPSSYQPAWYDDVYARKFFNLTTNGNKPIRIPMLVLQGEADPEILPPITCKPYMCKLSYIAASVPYLPGVTHEPIMYASQVTC